MSSRRHIRYAITLVLLDVLLWVVAAFVMLVWRLIADKVVLTRYLISYTLFCGVWIVVGCLVKKYRPWNQYSSKLSLVKLLLVAVATEVYVLIHGIFVYPDLSILTFSFGLLIVFTINAFIILCYYAYRYATYVDYKPKEYKERKPTNALETAKKLTDSQYNNLKRSLSGIVDNEAFLFLEETLPLCSTNTLILSTLNISNVDVLLDYRYECIINLKCLNDLVGINRFFCAVNAKLPDNGLFACTFISQDVFQLRILNKYPKFINRIVYDWNIFFKRIVPRTLLRRFYYRSKFNRNRFISKTEVLGRLYYCGFEVVNERVINYQNYIVARRKRMPYKQLPKRYGMIIKLPRVGKNGKTINVFKFRTMHPYSEYIQEYLYHKNDIEEGGKIKDDIRITSYGKFMRKYWLDEWPMFINLLKGEIKLVGVRPLSRHYYSLYNEELQKERIKYRPGLLPPFYVDMPKTLEEIEASELKYLRSCREKGVFRTDFVYFWRILLNIIVKRERSH